MILEEILTEKKVKNVKSSTHPRNTLVSQALSDMDIADSKKDAMRTKLRSMIVKVIRKNQALWTLDSSKLNNTMYKMVTPKETE